MLDNKLYANSEYVLYLTDFFEELKVPGRHGDLDVIATYLAYQMHFGFINEAKLDKLKKLTLQVATSLEQLKKEIYV